MKQRFLKFCVPLLSVLVILTVVLCSTFSCFASYKIGEYYTSYQANYAYPKIGQAAYIWSSFDDVYAQLEAGKTPALGYFITNVMSVPSNAFSNYDCIVIKGLNPDGLINTGYGASVVGYFYIGTTNAESDSTIRRDLSVVYSSNGNLVFPCSDNALLAQKCVFSIRAYNREVLLTDINNVTIYLDNLSNYEPDVSTTNPPELLYPAVDMWNAEIEALPSVFQNVTNAYFFENRFTTFGLVLFSVVGLGIISAIIALILKICRGDK